jgi:Neurotransmitter-gated ion-channel ligand binding domain
MGSRGRRTRAGAFGALLLALAVSHPGHGQSQPSPRPQPRKVMVTLLINSITDIDSARETFRGDAYLILRWQDPALLNVDPAKIDWSGTNKPTIEFMNSQDTEILGDQFPELASPGVGFVEARYTGTFNNRMDLHDFPFDEQIITFSLESQNETADKMTFFVQPVKGGVVLDVQDRTVPIPRSAIFGSEIHLPEWNITGADVRESKASYYGGTEAYSHLTYEVRIARRIGYYIWKVMSVLVMLVVLSWIIFLIDPADIGNRMAVSITLFLAAVAFAFVTGSLIPRVSYLTLLDKYTLGCYVLLFLAPLESLLAYRQSRQDQAKAQRTDRLALQCFPVAFLLLHLVIWIAGGHG